MSEARSFEPRVAPSTRVLVLGSMPGRRSLELQQYYGHPRNRLWPVLADLLGFVASTPYERRMTAALEAGVGFWDVLGFCERPGSLDTAIRRDTEIPNELPTLLREHPGIRALAFNGQKAARSFERHVSPLLATDRLAALDLLPLPSTSPANASWSFETLKERWSVLLRYL